MKPQHQLPRILRRAALSVLALILPSAALAEEAAGAKAGGRPKVLIMGDSIAGGYIRYVKGALHKRMDVVQAAGEQKNVIFSTPVALEHIDEWLGNTKWDVIHFNFGLHDLKIIDPAAADSEDPPRRPVGQGKPWVSVEDYEKNLLTLVKRMKQTGAVLIWCSTTPVPAGASGRVPGSEVAYNEAALRVMQAEGVRVNDLHAFVGIGEQRLKNGGLKADVHYRNANPGYQSLAREVVRAIESALK